MFPYITLFGREIAVYAIMALCGIFAAGITACRKAKLAGFDDTGMIRMLLAAGAGAFAGGHILYAAIHFRFIPFLLKAPGLDALLMRTGLLFSGQIFYGGLLGGIAAGCLYGSGKFKKTLPAVCDITSPVIPLFHFFGRIGCFGAGCCYGIEHRPGVTFFRAIIPQANFVSRLPVQLIEAGFNIFLFFLLSRIERAASLDVRRSAPGIMAHLKGKILFLYLLFYPLGRFFLEFFRGDEYRGIWGPLSTSQWISVFLVPAAVLGLVMPRKKSPGLVVLLGPKHSGKTSTGKILADLLAVPFYDLDTLVENKTGESPRALYSRGENIFRSAEYETLKAFLETTTETRSAAKRQVVLATGGGIIDNKKSVTLLSGGCLKIYLEADVETAWKRISSGPLPAFLDRENPKESHRVLHERRAKDYKAFADITVPVESKTPEETAREISVLF
ncbi:MAG: prolipoprotein diacylglyceryl transferase [Treponema sp.]|jgi:phosphatidylglycerol:prolipoprotein diacylglycerol transferase|nr:prolipoprotein diacylglyceryl transferase [Treponema sp.]